MKKLLLVFIMMFGLVIFTGCAMKEKRDSRILGTWEYTEKDSYVAIYSFQKDGTGSFTFTSLVEEEQSLNSSRTFTYVTKNNQILMTLEDSKNVFQLSYQIKDKSLILIDSSGKKTEFIKK